MAVVSVSSETDTTATNCELPARKQTDGTRIVPDAEAVVRPRAVALGFPSSGPLARVPRSPARARRMRTGSRGQSP